MLRLGIIVFSVFIIVSAEDVENNVIDLNKEGSKSINFINNSDVCHSLECYQIADAIWQSVNHSVNPCDNFYEYACGRFASSNPIPKEESAWSTIQKLRRTVKLQMLEIVTDGYKNSTDILPVKLMKKFYKSCISYWKIGPRGLKHIKAFLTQIDGWPLIMEREEWSSMKISWEDINQFYSRLLFLSSFYRIKVKSELKNLNDSTVDGEKSFKFIKIRPPTVPLKSMARYSGKIFNKKFTDLYDNGKYKMYIYRIANMLAFSRSAHINRTQLHDDVDDMIELEKKFLNIPDTHDSELPQYVTIDELQEIYDSKVKTPEKSKINWKEIIPDFFNEAKVQLNGSELFQITNEQHFETLVDILENTDQRTLANYMHWHFVSYLLPYTTLFLDALRINMIKHKDGIVNRPRWQNCIRNLAMPRVLAYEYAKKYMNNYNKDEVRKIFSSIQKEMVKHIQDADWLNDETRNNQLEKIENMKVNIGFPQWITNETALIEMYQGLVIGNQYMENIISIKRFNAKRALQYLRSSSEIKDWKVHPMHVKVLYFRKKNLLNIPAAALQAPLFSALQPNTVNYGTMGYKIAHKLAHGFDTTGIEYNKDGQKYDLPEDIKKAIAEKSECFANQYNQFKTSEIEDDKNEIETKLINENLSDSLGMNLVFSAWREIEKETKSLRLPGLKHWGNKKIFFLSFARLHCFNATQRHKELLENYYRRSSRNYRVNIPLQNSEEFAEAFNCPIDSPMNPSSKCKLW